jgi:kinesin family protein 2/24
MFVNHHDFSFDEVFDDTADNESVYTGSVQEIVRSVAAGGHGTVMMYGQTGSGKTYTMSSFYKQSADELFALVGSKVVTVCFIELLGDKSFDMLNGGAPCRLVSAPDGSVHPNPCVEVDVKDATELLALIRMAGKLRATAATGVHDQSSRSHALCRIFVHGPADGGTGEEGCLTLVDLAGTEHRIDNAEHNVERQREGAKINASLAALKDCIRATAAGAKFVAFRQNRLTQLLRGCFASTRPHPTVVIATVSPSSKDTEHSLNTLRHACIMDGQGDGKARQSAHVTGGAVTKEALGEIDVTGIARAKVAARRSGKSPRPPDERARPSLAHQTKQSNTVRRSTLDRRCIEALPADVSEKLRIARAGAGHELQRRRLQAPEADSESTETAKASVEDSSCFEGAELAREDQSFSSQQCPPDLEEDLLAAMTVAEDFPTVLQEAWEEHAAASNDALEKLPDSLRPAWAEQQQSFQALDDAIKNLTNVVQEQCSSLGHRGASKELKDFPKLPLEELLDGMEDEPFGEDGIPLKGHHFAASKELPRTPHTVDAPTDCTFHNAIKDEDSPSQSSEPEPESQQGLSRLPVGAAAASQPVSTFCGNSGEEADARSSTFSANMAGEEQSEQDVQKAEALFRLFCHEGREGMEWCKNDLRLINSCVLPSMFGPAAQIDWVHPTKALDELELLVCGPPPSKQGPEQSQERPRRLHGRQPSQQITMQEQSRSTQQLARSSVSSSTHPSGKLATRGPLPGKPRQTSSVANSRRDSATIGTRRSPSQQTRTCSSRSQVEATPPQPQRSISRASEHSFTPSQGSIAGKSQGESSPRQQCISDFPSPPRSTSGKSQGELTPLRRSASAMSPGGTPHRSISGKSGEPTPQQRTLRKPHAEQEWTAQPSEVTNMERVGQAANAEAGVKRWLEELRQQIRREEFVP